MAGTDGKETGQHGNVGYYLMVALKSSYSWKYCPSVCWVSLLVAAEALNFPLVSELALLAGSHFHLFFSWRQE